MTITIKNDFIFEEEIKKSRFICHLKRVTSEEEARESITSIKNSTIKPIIMFRHSQSVNIKKFSAHPMMASLLGQQVYRC
jgi:Uncharacterized conserved protein